MSRVLLVVALVAACHHAQVHKPGDEWLQAIEFEGNRSLSSSALLEGLALRRAEQQGRAADPYQVQLDTERLEGQYLREGFFDVDVQARIERKADAATVIFTIQEGRRATTRVEVSGLPPDVTAQDVRAKLPLVDNAPFVYEVYDGAKVPLLGVVQNAGYAHAKLDATVDAEIATHTAVIKLAYTPGPKCRFGTVEVQGVTGDLEQAILDRLHFQPGQVYSPDAVVATQRDIYTMNRFSTVQITPDSGDSAVVNLKIAVSEGARYQLTFGGGFGVDPISYEVRGRAGYMIAGFPAPLYNLNIDLRPAYAYLRDGSGFEPRMRAITTLDRQDLFVTHAKGTIELDFNYLAYEAFTEYGPEVQLGYEVQLGSPRFLLRGGWLIQRYDFRDLNPLVVGPIAQSIGLDQVELAAAYKESLVLDLRDNQVEPRFGFYAELQAFEGGPYAGGDYTYQQLIPEVRGYVPIGPIVLAARARYGAIWGQAPPTERFYAGGASSNRGFSERELSPSVTGPVAGEGTPTVPYGGTGMIDTSVEARIPIATIKSMPLHGVVFGDGGNVTLAPSELGLHDLYWAVGAGLRLLTVIGPVRVDLGYRINRTGAEDAEPGSTVAFHISLGEAF